ncbi:hypothetical protein [Paraburkholderia sp. BCC1886]|uniref:hypothetical protein n=1 Tax=Paraburkholderia sp. BCC1886 TaxID=2562670 RepID=UPI0011831B0A|nr:hypothetical protein [Paraburkholderia sp. BCC1886]
MNVMDHFLPDAHYGRVEITQLGLAHLSANQRDDLLEVRTRYFNFLPCVVTVIERNGLQWEFPSIPDPMRSAFVIRTDWRVHRSMHQAFINWIKMVRENESKQIRDLREIVTQHQLGPLEQHMLFRTEETITHEELRQHKFEIYDHHHDIVVSTFRGIEAGPHPFSEMGRALALLDQSVARGEREAFNEAIKIVDNAGRFGDRFINRNGSIYRISATPDATREDGVWVIRNKPFENTRLPSTVGWHRYTLEEADDILELYKTYVEAEHCGDGETKRKQELLAKEESLLKAKGELAEAKQAQMREQHEWEVEKTRIQQALERAQAAFAEEAFRAKMELDRMKAHYERLMLDAKATQERKKEAKETSEWLKQLPAILGALGVAYLAYKTAQMNSSSANKK